MRAPTGVASPHARPPTASQVIERLAQVFVSNSVCLLAFVFLKRTGVRDETSATFELAQSTFPPQEMSRGRAWFNPRRAGLASRPGTQIPETLGPGLVRISSLSRFICDTGVAEDSVR